MLRGEPEASERKRERKREGERERERERETERDRERAREIIRLARRAAKLGGSRRGAGPCLRTTITGLGLMLKRLAINSSVTMPRIHTAPC